MSNGRRGWTTSELSFLRRYDGVKSTKVLARELGRTPYAVDKQLQRMRPPDELDRNTGLVWCQTCCAWRSRVVLGRCPVCTRKDTKRAQMAREEWLLSRLTPEEAATRRPSRQGSRVDPMPRRPPGQTDDERAVAIEKAEAANLDRENSTRRTRIERLEMLIAARHAD